jgi:GNAT superfamily N-acetyltransferase
VVKYSRMPAHTLLKDVEAMQPLYSIIFRFFRFLPVSNFYSETVVKTLVKTLHPTQRREEATASRWVAALHRDPSRLARLTTSAVDWARGVLKRRKQEAAQRREAPSATKQHGSILGLASELDVPIAIAHKERDDESSGDGEQEAKEDSEDEREEEAEEKDLVELIGSAGAKHSEHVEYFKRRVDEVRSGLLVGQMVLVKWKKTEGFFLAQVAALPTTDRATTFQAFWWDEDEVEQNVYALDQNHSKSSAKLKDVVTLNPSLQKLSDGRWRLKNVLPPTEPAAEATESAVETVAPPDSSAKPSKGRAAVKHAVAKPAAAAAAHSSKHNVKAAAKPAKPVTVSDVPEEPETSASTFLDAADKMLRGAGKLRTDRPLLTRSDTEWLNDVQIANDNYVKSRPHLRMMYPKSLHFVLEGLHSARFLTMVDTPLHEFPTANFSLVQPCAVNQLHWHTFLNCFKEKVIYAFDGFGNGLPDRYQATFAQTMAPRGWQLFKVGLSLQYDSCSCGVWIQVARDAFAEYASAHCGTRTFERFLKDWLAQRGVKDLNDVQGAAARRIGHANNKFILEQRAEMRALLVQLAIEGRLHYGQAVLPGFNRPEVVVPDDDECYIVDASWDDACYIVEKPAPSLPPPPEVSHILSDSTNFKSVPGAQALAAQLDDVLSCYAAPSPSPLPKDLKRFAGICCELVPNLGNEHIRDMIHTQAGTFTVVVSDNGGRDGAARVIGGITSQAVAQPAADGELLIVDVLMAAVMTSQARKGLGTKLLGAVERIAQQLVTSRGSSGAIIYTQADEGEIASGFWERNGFVHSAEAAWLTAALNSWRPKEHFHYDGITSMLRPVAGSWSGGGQ